MSSAEKRATIATIVVVIVVPILIATGLFPAVIMVAIVVGGAIAAIMFVWGILYLMFRVFFEET